MFDDCGAEFAEFVGHSGNVVQIVPAEPELVDRCRIGAGQLDAEAFGQIEAVACKQVFDLPACGRAEQRTRGRAKSAQPAQCGKDGCTLGGTACHAVCRQRGDQRLGAEGHVSPLRLKVRRTAADSCQEALDEGIGRMVVHDGGRARRQAALEYGRIAQLAGFLPQVVVGLASFHGDAVLDVLVVAGCRALEVFARDEQDLGAPVCRLEERQHRFGELARVHAIGQQLRADHNAA